MKTVIITGASGNLGTVVTQYLLGKGYRVLATADSESTRAAMRSHDNLEVSTLNLADEKASGAFVQQAISTHGKIDAALLLAGGFAPGNIASATGADLQKQFSLNFETAYFIARPLFEHMLEQQNGRIVFIGARPALVAAQGKNTVAYGLSKSLLFKLAEYMNAEAKGKNVTVSVVVPSTIDTVPNRKSMPDANPADWVKPEQLAEILGFLVSDGGAALRETVLKVYNNA